METKNTRGLKYYHGEKGITVYSLITEMLNETDEVTYDETLKEVVEKTGIEEREADLIMMYLLSGKYFYSETIRQNVEPRRVCYIRKMHYV